MSTIFHSYIYAPILSALVWVYHVVPPHDLGLSIILLTIAVRVVLLPVFWKSTKDQTILQALQPKIKEIQEHHRDDKEAQGKALMALYKEHRVNPFSGILFLLIQLPIFFALFRIFTQELGNAVFDTPSFLGLINLEEKNIILAIVAAALQLLQAKLMAGNTVKREKDRTAGMTKMFGYVVGPGITLIVLTSLPSALGLYWVASNLFSIVQQIVINKNISSQLPKEIVTK